MMVVTAHLLFCTPWSTMTVAKVYDPFQRQPVHGELPTFDCRVKVAIGMVTTMRTW